jgi:hypothetical protein
MTKGMNWKDHKRDENKVEVRRSWKEQRRSWVGVRNTKYLQRVECNILTYGPKRKCKS